jgi:hypothetical protein
MLFHFVLFYIIALCVRIQFCRRQEKVWVIFIDFLRLTHCQVSGGDLEDLESADHFLRRAEAPKTKNWRSRHCHLMSTVHNDRCPVTCSGNACVSESIITPLKPKLVKTIFKNSVRTTKKTQLFTITSISWLKLFKEIIAVYNENHTKSINTKWRVIDC